LANLKVASKYSISKITFFLIILVLVSGTISQVEYSVVASTSGGEEGSSNGDVEGSGTTEGGEDEEGMEAPPDNKVSDNNDDADTEGVASEQESACPAVAFEGPSYTDENGCPAPCPPPPPPNARDANIAEECPNPSEGQTLPGTQSLEEQTALPVDTATPPLGQQQAPPEEQLAPSGSSLDDATGGAGGSAEICEDGIDNDNNGELDENICIISSLDGDGDGVQNGKDNCPFASNLDQNDTDSDGVGDACPELGPPVQIDTDTDSDGLLGSTDNCPSYYNPVQTDTDGDGEGDVCDPVAEENTAENCRDGIDNDGDGVADGHDTGCNQVLYEPYEVTCDDGIDNDADTLIDLQDPDDCQDDTEEYGGGVTGEPPFRAPK
jgi:hypothetical protein